MKIFATVVFLFLISEIPVKTNADYDEYEDEHIYPHQEHRLCDSRHCENTCERPDARNRPCPFRLCHEGYFCEFGYVREFQTDQCILPSDCPATMKL